MKVMDVFYIRKVKDRWARTKIGVLLEREEGQLSLCIDAIPVDWLGIEPWYSIFENPNYYSVKKDGIKIGAMWDKGEKIHIKLNKLGTIELGEKNGWCIVNKERRNAE